jgi:hypothetical protein
MPSTSYRRHLGPSSRRPQATPEPKRLRPPGGPAVQILIFSAPGAKQSRSLPFPPLLRPLQPFWQPRLIVVRKWRRLAVGWPLQLAEQASSLSWQTATVWAFAGNISSETHPTIAILVNGIDDLRMDASPPNSSPVWHRKRTLTAQFIAAV